MFIPTTLRSTTHPSIVPGGALLCRQSQHCLGRLRRGASSQWRCLGDDDDVQLPVSLADLRRAKASKAAREGGARAPAPGRSRSSAGSDDAGGGRRVSKSGSSSERSNRSASSPSGSGDAVAPTAPDGHQASADSDAAPRRLPYRSGSGGRAPPSPPADGASTSGRSAPWARRGAGTNAGGRRAPAGQPRRRKEQGEASEPEDAYDSAKATALRRLNTKAMCVAELRADLLERGHEPQVRRVGCEGASNSTGRGREGMEGGHTGWGKSRCLGCTML